MRSAASRSQAEPDPGAVEAQLKFIVPTTVKPFSYEYEPPPGVPLRSAQFQTQRILVRNARLLANAPALDRQAFALRRHSTRVGNFYDNAEVEAIYYPEVGQLLKDATGARSILIFDHTVRGDDEGDRNGTTVKPPVVSVHNDYTPRSGRRRLYDLLPRAEAVRLLRHRVLEVNVWRPIRGPLRRMPLAVCDATSMRPGDFVACDLRYRDRVGEIHYGVYRNSHRWYYYPDMQRDEALLLKCFDTDPVRGATGVHAAFEHPQTPADALLRESIEVRAFVFFAPPRRPARRSIPPGVLDHPHRRIPPRRA